MTHLKAAMRAALYYSGLLGAIHRLRNRRTLTTLMFHRVLPAGSSQYLRAEREFTFTVKGFGRCLDFVKKHYNVVKLQDVLDAATGLSLLPPNAALITIDDGWRDAMLHAAPELKLRGLSAVLFLSTEVLASPYDRWWQDALVSLLADQSAAQRLAGQLGLSISSNAPPHKSLAGQMTALLADLPEARRFELLAAALPGVLEAAQGRQMLAAADVANIDRTCLELAAHGHTHAPLTQSVSAANELQLSLDIICRSGAYPAAMSFPHGAHDVCLLKTAGQMGFKLSFTSAATLSVFRKGRQGSHGIGRIHMPENQWTTNEGDVSFPLLATFLFFRPHEFPV